MLGGLDSDSFLSTPGYSDKAKQTYLQQCFQTTMVLGEGSFGRVSYLISSSWYGIWYKYAIVYLRNQHMYIPCTLKSFYYRNFGILSQKSETLMFSILFGREFRSPKFHRIISLWLTRNEVFQFCCFQKSFLNVEMCWNVYPCKVCILKIIMYFAGVQM